MKGVNKHCGLGRWGFLAMLLLSTVSLRANPIEIDASPVFRMGNLTIITLAILVESLCVVLMLRRRRTPRLFLLWLMGMHLVTYPLFLGLLWLSLGMRPSLAIVFGEGVIVLLEGSFIYLMCRFTPSARSALPSPSVGRSLLASLIGNIGSVVAYPLLTMVNAWIDNSMGRPGLE